MKKRTKTATSLFPFKAEISFIFSFDFAAYGCIMFIDGAFSVGMDDTAVNLNLLCA